MSKINVLLIENQYVQFRNIRARLLGIKDVTYHVFPEPIDDPFLSDMDMENYRNFMDQVRIALNPRYGKHCGEAFKEVMKYITQKKPDIFIIDHKLVGNEQAETGIDLARKLWDVGKYEQPVLFLSRTPESKREVVEKLDGFINNFRWLYKGYSDHEILDHEYFSGRISPAIKDLLQITHEQSEEENAQLILSGLFADNTVEDIIDSAKLAELRNRSKKVTSLTLQEKELINTFKVSKWPNREVTKKFYLETLTNIIKRYEV